MLPEWIESNSEPCGSRITCFPPPVDTDADYLMEVLPHDVAGVISRLASEGFEWEGSPEHYQDVAGSGFMSWRRGQLNVIVTASPEFAKRHRAATGVCKRLNLLSKADRVAVFRAVLYHEIAE